MNYSLSLRWGAVAVLAAMVALTLAPLTVFAHQTFHFQINGDEYEMVVGSLNEPIHVDDKTGASLSVDRNGTPATGLEETLNVELQAGGQKKALAFDTQYGTPGAYEAIYIPTVATQMQYRVFGEINGTSFDHTFACNPNHPQVNEEEQPEDVQISETVTLESTSGSFSCPQPKTDLGFPEESASINSLKTDTSNLTASVQDMEGPDAMSMGAGVLALAALVLGGLAVRRKRQ